MKKLCFIVMILMWGIYSVAQVEEPKKKDHPLLRSEKSDEVPELIDFQGRLADSEGNPLNGSHNLTFRIYDSSSGGASLWFESRTIQIVNGLFQVKLGEVSPLAPGIFSGANRWLGIKINSDAEMTPRTQISSVGYAMQTADIEPVWILNDSDETKTYRYGNVGIGFSNPNNPLTVYSNNIEPALFRHNKSSGSTVGTILKLHVGGSGNPQPGLGGSLDWSLESSNGGMGLAGRIAVTWENALIGSTASDMRFYTYGNGSIRERIRINSSGNMGIGINAPDARLHVYTTQGNALNINNRLYVNAASGQVLIEGNPGSTGLIWSKQSNTNDTPAVFGDHIGNSPGWGIGVSGRSSWRGVSGQAMTSGSGSRTGVYGMASAQADINYGIYGTAFSGTINWAGYFAGNANVTGTLYKGSGAFRIDHPLDPENKFLQHSFVESPDMMNIYNGNVITDEKGYASINLPDWFGALNEDFRYQLTVVDLNDTDDFVLAKVVREVENNQFAIRTNKPHIQVSWQVTGIRHDPYAAANRIEVEVDKQPHLLGKFVHPEVRGLKKESGIDWEDSQPYKSGIQNNNDPSAINGIEKEELKSK